MGTSAFGAPLREVLVALALWLAMAVGGICAEPVKIEFIPPPMEGTISLGIYDSAGKLVRILHREDPVGEPESKLTAGDNGLLTQWDGNNDQGKPCPPGTYRARGVMVGDLEVEGVDFIGNDWVTGDDSPRVKRIMGVATADYCGEPVLAVLLVGCATPSVYHVGMKTATPPDALEVQLLEKPGDSFSSNLLRVIKTGATPIDMCPKTNLPAEYNGIKDVADWRYGHFFGRDTPVWVIQKGIVREYSKHGEALRILRGDPDDPPAVRLTSSIDVAMLRSVILPRFKNDPNFGVFANGKQLCVLYENAMLQRLRCYDFTGVKDDGEPKVLFEQDIRASDTYEQIASELKFPDEKPFVPSPVLSIDLVPNPLANNKPGTLQIRAGVDKAGCYLETMDGLPLCHISETKNLRWASMGRPAGSKALTVFDSDGAVVEQFQVSKPGNMMTFDAGPVQWPGAATNPAPSPAASSTPAPTATPSTPVSTPTPPVKSPL